MKMQVILFPDFHYTKMLSLKPLDNIGIFPSWRQTNAILSSTESLLNSVYRPQCLEWMCLEEYQAWENIQWSTDLQVMIYHWQIYWGRSLLWRYQCILQPVNIVHAGKPLWGQSGKLFQCLGLPTLRLSIELQSRGEKGEGNIWGAPLACQCSAPRKNRSEKSATVTQLEEATSAFFWP